VAVLMVRIGAEDLGLLRNPQACLFQGFKSHRVGKISDD
jgi:hypothetical protein